MSANKTPRIKIEDLAVEQMTEEQMAEIIGAGQRSRRLGVEGLETRDLMATNLMASLAGGVLRVEGTPNADSIRITQSADQISIQGIAIQSGGASVASVSVGAISRIEIASLGGADSVFAELDAQPLKAPLALTTGAAGDYFSDSVSRVGQAIGSEVVKLLRSRDGTVFQIQTDGWLSVNGKHALAVVKDIALGNGGEAYILEQNGNLTKFAAGGVWLARALERVDAATLKSSLQGLDMTSLQVAVNLIDLPTLAVGMTRVDTPTLRNIVNVIDPARLDAVLAQLDQPTRDLARSYMPSVESFIRMPLEGLRPALAGLSQPWLKYVVEHLDATTLKNALQQMDLATLKRAVIAIDLPTLAAGLQRIDGATLDNVLKVIDPAQLAAVFSRLDSGTQVAVRDRVVTPYTRMTREQLKPALEALSAGWLKFVVERIDAATLKNALEVVNSNTLDVAVNSIDLPTLNAGLVRVDGATLSSALKVIDPSQLASVMPMLDAATQQAVRDRVIAPYVSMTREQLTPALAALSQGWLKFIIERVDGATLKNALERMDPATLQRTLNAIDLPTLAAGLPRIDGATLDNVLKVIDPAQLAAVFSRLDSGTQVAVRDRVVTPYTRMTREQLKPALEALSAGWLKFVVERVDAATLKNALEVVNPATLQNAVNLIDLPTLAVGVPRVDGVALASIVKVIDPTRLDTVLTMVDAATQQAIRDRMPSIDGFLRMTREQLKPALEALSPGWLACVLTRLDAATLKNALEVVNLATLGKAVNGIDLATLAAGLPRVGAGTLDDIVKVIEPSRLLGVMSMLDSETQAAARTRMLSADVGRSLRYAEGGGKLFFLEGGLLLAFDPTNSSVRDFNNGVGVRAFAVTSGDVYLWENYGSLPLTRRNFDGSGVRVLDYQQADGKLFFLNGGHLWAFNPATNSVVDFNNGGGVQAFAVNSGGVYLWEANGTLFRRNFDGSQGSGALDYKQIGGTNLFFLEGGGDGHNYLMALDPAGHVISRFNSTEVRAFAVRGTDVYMWEGGANSYLRKQDANATTWSDPLDYREVGGKLYFIDTDACLRVMYTATGTIADKVNGFTLSGEIARKWLELAGQGIDLGAPVSQATDFDGDLFQDFENGVIYELKSTTHKGPSDEFGIHVIMGTPTDIQDYLERITTGQFLLGKTTDLFASTKLSDRQEYTYFAGTQEYLVGKWSAKTTRYRSGSLSGQWSIETRLAQGRELALYPSETHLFLGGNPVSITTYYNNGMVTLTTFGLGGHRITRYYASLEEFTDPRGPRLGLITIEDGALISAAESSAVYLIENGQRRHIRDESLYETTLDLNKDHINDLRASEVDLIPWGNPLIDEEQRRLDAEDAARVAAQARANEFERLRAETRQRIKGDLESSISGLPGNIHIVDVTSLVMDENGTNIHGEATITVGHSWGSINVPAPTWRNPFAVKEVEAKATETFTVTFHAQRGESPQVDTAEKRITVSSHGYSMGLTITIPVGQIQSSLQDLWNAITGAGDAAANAGKSVGGDIAREGKKAAGDIAREVKSAIDLVLDATVPDFVEDTIRNFGSGLQKLAAALPQIPSQFAMLTKIDFNAGVEIPSNLEPIRDAIGGLSVGGVLDEQLKGLLSRLTDLDTIKDSLLEGVKGALDRLRAGVEFNGNVVTIDLPEIDGFKISFSGSLSGKFSGSITYSFGDNFSLNYEVKDSGSVMTFGAVFKIPGMLDVGMTIDLKDRDAPVVIKTAVTLEKLSLTAQAAATGTVENPSLRLESVAIKFKEVEYVKAYSTVVSIVVGFDGVSAVREGEKWKVTLDVTAGVRLNFGNSAPPVTPEVGAEKGKRLVILIGGSGEEHLAPSGREPVLNTMGKGLYEAVMKEQPGADVACFYWDQGRLAANYVREYLSRHPGAEVAIYGHSYGGDTAVEVAGLLNEGTPVEIKELVTLDPVSKQAHFGIQATRPDNVRYWANVPVEGITAEGDWVATVGGRWGHQGAAHDNVIVPSGTLGRDGRRLTHGSGTGLYEEYRKRHPL